MLRAFSDAPPCRRKTRGPAEEAARAEAARLATLRFLDNTANVLFVGPAAAW